MDAHVPAILTKVAIGIAIYPYWLSHIQGKTLSSSSGSVEQLPRSRNAQYLMEKQVYNVLYHYTVIRQQPSASLQTSVKLHRDAICNKNNAKEKKYRYCEP